MILRAALVFFIYHVNGVHCFSSNLGYGANNVHNSLIPQHIDGARLPMVPRIRSPYRWKKSKSSQLSFGRGKDGKTIEVEKKSEKQRDKYLLPPLNILSDGLPWEGNPKNSKDMGDLSQLLKAPVKENNELLSIIDDEEKVTSLSSTQIVSGVSAMVLLGVPFFLNSLGLSTDVSEISQQVRSFLADPTTSLEAVLESVKSMGPLGALYFGVIYTIAEVLALPSVPLTASAGYLFGVTNGTIIVLLSASIAATIGFLLGRTFLRTYVERILEDKPEFQRIDKAIGREGFKVILLLRLSPLFPFALSNYLFGVTSVDFWPYFFGTTLGFFPGTLAYVYTGEIGKALTVESGAAQPWYVYAGGLALFAGFLKIVADVATGILQSLEEEDGL